MVTLCGLLVKVAFWSWVVSMTCNDWQNPCGSVLHRLIGSVVPSCVGCRGPEVEMESRLDFKYSEIHRSKNKSLATSRTSVKHKSCEIPKIQKGSTSIFAEHVLKPKICISTCYMRLAIGINFWANKISSKKKHTHTTFFRLLPFFGVLS